MPYIDENKASEVTGIPVPTLRTKRVRGSGPPFYRIGRAIRYDHDELIAWMKERRALNTTDADQVAARLRAAGGANPQLRSLTAKPE
jgi:hypothetical protein